MKLRLKMAEVIQKIGSFSKDLGGVFTFSDLWPLIGLGSSDRTAKVVNRLVRDGVLFKVRRGLYVTRDADLWVLASRLRQGSYISLDSVLARNGLIGTIPSASVSAVSTGNPKTVETPVGRVRFFKIKPDLIFDLAKAPNGVVVAGNEKAYLDMLYYHVKGVRFVVDPLKDIDLWKLDRTKLRKDLKRYRNPKFRRFVEGLIREQD